MWPLVYAIIKGVPTTSFQNLVLEKFGGGVLHSPEKSMEFGQLCLEGTLLAGSAAFCFSVNHSMMILIHISGKSDFLLSGHLLYSSSQPEHATTTHASNEQRSSARKQPGIHEHAWKPSLHSQQHDSSLQWKSGTAVCAKPQWPFHGQCSSVFFELCLLLTDTLFSVLLCRHVF